MAARELGSERGYSMRACVRACVPQVGPFPATICHLSNRVDSPLSGRWAT